MPLAARQLLRFPELGRDHGLEGGIEQLLHEAVGGVVAATGLAGIALGKPFGGEPDETKGAGRQIDRRDQFEEAFVD